MSQTTFRRPNVATRIVFAVAAFATSASVLGTVCGAFEMQSNQAMLARASAPAVVATAATTGTTETIRVAVR